MICPLCGDCEMPKGKCERDVQRGRRWFLMGALALPVAAKLPKLFSWPFTEPMGPPQTMYVNAGAARYFATTYAAAFAVSPEAFDWKMPKIGSDPINPYPTLAEALKHTKAKRGDTVIVLPQHYERINETLDIPEKTTFQMRESSISAAKGAMLRFGESGPNSFLINNFFQVDS